jgi:hypothetical protein
MKLSNSDRVEMPAPIGGPEQAAAAAEASLCSAATAMYHYGGPQVKPISYILMRCDTRPLEFISGVFLFIWALWLLTQMGQPLTTFQATIGHTGGIGVWAGLALFNFMYQVVSIQWRWPTLRRSASFLSCTYWVWVAVQMLGDVRLFFPYIAIFWAAVQFWILARRVAVGK